MLKYTQNKTVLLSVLLSLLSAGCATQNLQADSAKPTASPQVAKASTPAPQPAAVAPQAVAASQPLAAPTALETQTGMQIVHVGVTAQGGLVDVRFKVLDAAKVKALMGNPANVPMLIAGDMPPLMPPHKALHGARFGQGQVVYILYPNLRRSIKTGGEVTVAVGDVRLGPLAVQ